MTKGLMSFNLEDKLDIAIKCYEEMTGTNKLQYCCDIGQYFKSYVEPMIGLIPDMHADILKAIYDDIDVDVQDRLANVLYIIGKAHQEICESRRKRGKKSMKKSFEGMFDGIMEKMMPRRVEDGEVAMTMNGGLAVKRADGDYVSYDPVSGKIVNSMQFVINNDTIGKFIFLMPMAQLQAGDIIKNNKTYYYVREIYNGGVKVISLNSGAHSNIVEEQNIIFGTTMYSKVVSLFNMAGGQQATGGMFGQFNPIMLMALMDKSEDGDGNGMDFMEAMVMMQMFGNGQGMFGNMFNGLGGVQNQ
ncbi:MAG: hypothetical protein NC247_02185 [Ruminococcus flavefaciens]|nr:hypothetical protein [Ruminococcus flavefaciens]